MMSSNEIEIGVCCFPSAKLIGQCEVYTCRMKTEGVSQIKANHKVTGWRYTARYCHYFAGSEKRIKLFYSESGEYDRGTIQTKWDCV